MVRRNVNSLSFLISTALGFLAVLAVPVSAWSRETLWVLMEEKVIWVLDTSDIAEKPGQAEATLIEELAALGYEVVDSAAVRRNITQAQGLRTLEGDDQAAAAIGLQHGAEYSVVGNAIGKFGAFGVQGSNLKTVHATVNARIIRNADARIVASASANANVAHLDEVTGGGMAIEQAARELAGKLDRKFRDLGGIEQSEGAEMMLNISSLKSFRQLDAIMEALEGSAPGVEKVDLGSFTSGTAQVTVSYRGELRELASHLARERFNGFRLEPTHVTSNRIDLKSVAESDGEGGGE